MKHRYWVEMEYDCWIGFDDYDTAIKLFDEVGAESLFDAKEPITIDELHNKLKQF